MADRLRAVAPPHSKNINAVMRAHGIEVLPTPHVGVVLRLCAHACVVGAGLFLLFLAIGRATGDTAYNAQTAALIEVDLGRILQAADARAATNLLPQLSPRLAQETADANALRASQNSTVVTTTAWMFAVTGVCALAFILHLHSGMGVRMGGYLRSMASDHAAYIALVFLCELVVVLVMRQRNNNLGEGVVATAIERARALAAQRVAEAAAP